MLKDFKDWQTLFDRVGDSYVHPKQYGDCFWPVSIEDLYQAFKSRMLAESKPYDCEMCGGRVIAINSDSAGDSHVE